MKDKKLGRGSGGERKVRDRRAAILAFFSKRVELYWNKSKANEVSGVYEGIWAHVEMINGSLKMNFNAMVGISCAI